MTFSNDQPLVANQVADTDYADNFDDFKEQFDRENKRFIDALNSKEGALYLPQELATFQRYFDEENTQETRNVYRKLIVFGALPNATSKRVQHNITFTNVTRMTRLYGAATDPSSIQFISLPFSSPILANNVSLQIDETDVIITSGIDLSNYINTTVVMEYTKG